MTNRWLISLTLLTSLSLNTFAQDAVQLEKDQKAPFTGILITNAIGNEMRSAVIERDAFAKMNESLNKIVTSQDSIISKQNQQKTILLEQNDKLALRLGDERSMGNYERIGWFVLGIVATGAAGYAIGRIQVK